MIEIWVAIGTFACFLSVVLLLVWKVIKLDRENLELKGMISSTAALVYELSKLGSIIQDGTIEQGKGLVMLSKHSKETREELVDLKSNVDKFVAFMVQQLNALHGVKGQAKTASTAFGPVKKNDKIKPN